MDEVTKVQMASNDEGKSTNPYIVQHIPSGIIQQLEAGAFRSLVSHLQDRSDQVQNIDLMTVSGFCRNCLAKVGQGQGTGQGLYLGMSQLIFIARQIYITTIFPMLYFFFF
jgi:hypothetical protein